MPRTLSIAALPQELPMPTTADLEARAIAGYSVTIHPGHGYRITDATPATLDELRSLAD